MTDIICEISPPIEDSRETLGMKKDLDHLSNVELSDLRACRAEEVPATTGCHFWQSGRHKAFSLRIIMTYY
jgi:hypothetical protein